MTIRTALTAATLACAALGAQAETLRVADSLPVGHYFSEGGLQYWMEEVTKRTDGAVTFEHYPASQLGKAQDMFDLALNGVSDISYVATSYVSDKLPLSGVAEMPGTFATSCEGTNAYWKLARADGFLAQNEYDPAGVTILFALVLSPYQIYQNKPIEGIDSFEGQKMRISSVGQAAIVESMGGVPVRMPAPEIYDALSRGTVDGVLLPGTALLTYDLHGLVKSGTEGANFGTATLTYLISNQKLESLPEELQQVMLDVGAETTQRACDLAEKSVADDITRIAAAGVEGVKLSDADKEAIAMRTDVIFKDWAADLDARGLPGTEAVEAYKAALE